MMILISAGSTHLKMETRVKVFDTFFLKKKHEKKLSSLISLFNHFKMILRLIIILDML